MRFMSKLVLIFAFICEVCKCYDGDNDTLLGLRAIRTGPKPPWNETYVDKLRNDLLTNYDKYARPGQHYDVTTVHIGLYISYLETDELNSTVSVASLLKLIWSDPKFKWNKDDYGGIDSIKMADHELWQPDIYLFNSALGGEAVTRYGNPHAIIYSDGEVSWSPPSKFNALCEFDFYYWPFDTQRCYLKFGSWTHPVKEIKLQLFESKIYTDVTISPWKINSSGGIVIMQHEYFADAFYNAVFNLTLTRASSSYVPVVVAPVVAVISLILIQCCLPSHSGERIILSSCTAVMVTMLLAYFTQKVSAIGLHTPWIVSFYSTSLYLVCFSIAEFIFVLLLLKTEQKKALPWNIKKHLQGRFGKLLLLEHCTLEGCGTIQSRTAEEMKNYHRSEFEDKIEENDVIIRATSKSFIHREWEVLAVAVDRVTFLIYSFIFFVLIMCYLI